jgi:formylglycine-generating enzyme required for sulfatase activity
MKNTGKRQFIKGVAVIALAVIIGVSMATCDDNDDDDKDDGNGNNNGNIEMVRIPGGSFEMGNPDTTYSDEELVPERPVHLVTLSSFYMGKYEVTQEQWVAVMENNPSSMTNFPAYGEVQNKRPVNKVTWYNAIVFCNKLSMAEGLSPAYSISGITDPTYWGKIPTDNNSIWNAVEIVAKSNGYRLPTEAQWEYAARGGNGSPENYTYSGSNDVDSVAWYSDNCIDYSDFSISKTHEVGKKAPNGLGLYDMSGNVLEWCWDWCGDYTSAAQMDPTGPVSGTYRVSRGGSYNLKATQLRSTSREECYSPYIDYHALGLRLVRP